MLEASVLLVRDVYGQAAHPALVRATTTRVHLLS